MEKGKKREATTEAGQVGTILSFYMAVEGVSTRTLIKKPMIKSVRRHKKQKISAGHEKPKGHQAVLERRDEALKTSSSGISLAG